MRAFTFMKNFLANLKGNVGTLLAPLEKNWLHVPNLMYTASACQILQFYSDL